MIKVGLIFGGKSGEHEVSVRSAEAIRANLDKQKYEVVEVFVDKLGKFELPKVEVVFPIVHGTYGEDGCLQGMLEIADVAYVGAGVLGSAIGMDKDVQKRLLLQAGISVARFVSVSNEIDNFIKQVGYPVFVKPANMGSSVGISKCKSKSELDKAIKLAFKYDTKVIIEEAIKGREMEVAILGGQASKVGEIVPVGHDFYDYEAKYIDEKGAKLQIPAKITQEEEKKIQKIGEQVFKVLECEGMARVDVFLKKNGEVVVNEINTLPGFTSVSMYPKLWEISGISYAKLLDKLIELAILRHKKKSTLRRNYIMGADERNIDSR